MNTTNESALTLDGRFEERFIVEAAEILAQYQTKDGDDSEQMYLVDKGDIIRL